MPHHITQRGINRDPVFTTDRSREVYLSLLREHAQRQQLRILAYCLMTNHVHLLLAPSSTEGLGKLMKTLAARMTRYCGDCYLFAALVYWAVLLVR